MRAFVHIGMSKTGTTSIQRALWSVRGALAEKGVCYPGVGFNHGFTIGSLFVPDPNDWPPNRRLGIDAESRLAETWRQIEHELARKPHTLVISGEALFGMPPVAIQAMKDWLETVAEETTILLYVREPRSWATSSMQQRLKAAAHLNLDNLPTQAIRARLERWIEVFGRQAITVNDFDAACRHPHSVVGHFLDLIGLSEFAPQLAGVHENRSLPASAVATIAERSRSLGRRLTRAERSEIAANASGEPFRLPDHVLAEVDRQARPDLDWLAVEFGIRFDSCRRDRAANRCPEITPAMLAAAAYVINVEWEAYDLPSDSLASDVFTAMWEAMTRERGGTA